MISSFHSDAEPRHFDNHEKSTITGPLKGLADYGATKQTEWCAEVWAEGNWLQRGAGIEGVIHGGREGKERKRCRARERGCRWQGSWGSGLVIAGDARVQQRCSRDTGSVRSHFGTWYAASGWKTLPFSLLPLSLSACLLSSSAHDDEETTTPRRTRVIMLIFMAAPLWSVAAASSPSWSRLGHRRRADSFPSHLTVTSPHVLNFFFPSSLYLPQKIHFIHPPECWLSLFDVLLNHPPISIIFMLDQNFSSSPLTTLLPIIIFLITLRISLHSEHNPPSCPNTCWIFPFHLSMSAPFSFLLHIYRGMNTTTS